MLQGRHRQQTGVLHDHLMVLHHVEERDYQLLIPHRDDVVQIFLKIWENVRARCLDRRAVRDGIHARQCHNMPHFKRFLHAIRPCRLHANHTDFRI